MSVNFLDILLQGYYNENNWEYYDEYLHEMYAECKESYSPKRFFGGCLKAVELLKKNIDQQVFRKKEGINQGLIRSREMIESGDGNKEELQKYIEGCKLELTRIRHQDHSVTLFYVTDGKYQGHLMYNQVLIIEQEVLNVIDSYLNPSKTESKSDLSFESLFEYPDSIQDCIDVLKEVEPPIISEDEKFIGKYKSSFVVWIDVMQQKGLCAHVSDREIYASLLSERFSFEISGSTFSKHPTRAEELYKRDFQVKLSQVSQKVK